LVTLSETASIDVLGVSHLDLESSPESFIFI